MKKNEDSIRLRGKLMLTGTLAMFAMGTMHAEAATPSDRDESKPSQPETGNAVAEQKATSQTVHKFDVPAGTVGQVMEAIQKQAGIRISLGNVDQMVGIASPGTQGVLTLQEALEQSLADTGLSARFEGENSVRIELRENKDSVVVTADNSSSNLKYTAPLVDLPQTLTIVGQDTIQYTASTSLVEALRTVPGITFGAGEGGNPLGDRPFIRGLDSQSSTYIDGMRDIAAQSREVFDVDSIEVQEGPGGAYGGRGTGGGSINMNSKVARRDNFIAGSFMPGTPNYYRGTVDGNVKLGRFVAGRLSGMSHSQDIAGRDAAHNQRWGFAPSIVIGLGYSTRAYFDYYHLVTNNLPDSGVPYNNPNIPAANLIPKNYGPQVYQRGDGSPLKLPRRGIFWGLKDRDHDKEYAKTATGRVEHDLWHEHALIRNSFRYERTAQDYVWTLPDDSKGNILWGYLFRRINSRVNAVFTADNQTDLSGTFNTGKIKHTYATGMEFSKERGNIDTYTHNSTTYGQTGTGSETCPNGVGAASGYNCTLLYSPNFRDDWKATGVIYLNHQPTHSVATSKSVYGFDTIVFNKHFQSTVGARYDRFDSQYRTALDADTYNVSNNIGTYIASLVYKPDQATSVYGSVSTAAIPTGNALAQGTDTAALNSDINKNLKPQFIRQEEFGVKRELAGGRALARIDVFRTDIENVRIADTSGSVSVAGNNRTIGFQGGISGQVTRKWQLTGGYTFLDAVLVNTGNGGTANGQAMPNTARHSVSVTSNYEITHRLRVGGGIYSNTKVWGSQLNNKWVPGYARVDIFGNYAISKHYNLQANIQNLGDKLYYQQAYASHYAVMAPGRSAVFGINVKF